MRILALAQCINGSHSGNLIMTGEYYLLEHQSRVERKDSPIHQGNVFAHILADENLILENFTCPEGGFYVASEKFSSEVRTVPVFLGARHRFELVFLPGQLKAAILKVAERNAHVNKARETSR